ncbi:MAG: diacylglycerol kinase family protein [Bacteroidota bacterium]
MNPLKKRIKSFEYAFKGILILFKTQPNAIIHLCAAVSVVVLGIVYSVSLVEWLFLVFSIALVMVAEAINSSIEFLGDAVSQEENEWIGKSKDLGAGAVLLAAIFATIVGLIIFLPKF